jgi:hypothetical protein
LYTNCPYQYQTHPSTVVRLAVIAAPAAISLNNHI